MNDAKDFFRINAQENLGLDPISCSGKQIREHSHIMYDLIEEDKWKVAFAYGKDQGWFIEVWFWSEDRTSHWRLIDLKKSYRTIYDAYQNNDIPAMKQLAKIEQFSIEIKFKNQDQVIYDKRRNEVMELLYNTHITPITYLQKLDTWV